MVTFLDAPSLQGFLAQLGALRLQVYRAETTMDAFVSNPATTAHLSAAPATMDETNEREGPRTVSPPPDQHSSKVLSTNALSGLSEAERASLIVKPGVTNLAATLQIPHREGAVLTVPQLRLLEKVLLVNAAEVAACEEIMRHLVAVGFPAKILALYIALDDLMDRTALTTLSSVLSVFFVSASFHSRELLSAFVSEDNLFDTICALENVPARVPGRSYEAAIHGCQLKNPLEFGEDVCELMRRIFLIFFLKDSVLSLDAYTETDEFLSTQGAVLQGEMISFILLNEAKVDVISRKLLSEIQRYQLSTSADVKCDSVSKMAEMAQFVHSLVNDLMCFPPDERTVFFVRICEGGLLKHLQFAVREMGLTHALLPQFKILSQALAETWKRLLIIDTPALRQYVASEPQLLKQIFTALLLKGDPGVRNQWQEVSLLLLETRAQRQRFTFIATSSPNCADPEPEFFSFLYYDPAESPLNALLHSFNSMISTLSAFRGDGVEKPIPSAPTLREEAEVFIAASAVISCCLQGHWPFIGEWVMFQHIPEKISAVSDLLFASGGAMHKSVKGDIALPCVWILRALVECESKAVHAVLEEREPFSGLLQMIEWRGLLASACLAVFDQVWKLNRSSLLAVIVAHNRKFFETMRGTSLGTNLLSRHSKNLVEAENSNELPDTPVCDAGHGGSRFS